MIKGVKEGKTRSVIFEEQSEILGRTAYAIQYRWNTKFAKLYKDEMEK